MTGRTQNELDLDWLFCTLKMRWPGEDWAIEQEAFFLFPMCKQKNPSFELLLQSVGIELSHSKCWTFLQLLQGCQVFSWSKLLWLWARPVLGRHLSHRAFFSSYMESFWHWDLADSNFQRLLPLTMSSGKPIQQHLETNQLLIPVKSVLNIIEVAC